MLRRFFEHTAHGLEKMGNTHLGVLVHSNEKKATLAAGARMCLAPGSRIEIVQGWTTRLRSKRRLMSYV